MFLRFLFVVVGLVQVVGLVLFLNRVAAVFFQVAESMPFVQHTWVWGPLQQIEWVAYTLIVPIFIVDLVLYLAIASWRDEREQRQRAQVVRRP